jgi:hypothetical protein
MRQIKFYNPALRFLNAILPSAAADPQGADQTAVTKVLARE